MSMTVTVNSTGVVIKNAGIDVLNVPASGNITTGKSLAAGVRTQQLVTTDNIDTEFSISKNSPGWQKLPGGMILQWGNFTFQPAATGASAYGSLTYASNVVFPLAFPTAVIAVQLAPWDVNEGAEHIANVYASSKTSFAAMLIRVAGSTNGSEVGSCLYFALGY